MELISEFFPLNQRIFFFPTYLLFEKWHVRVASHILSSWKHSLLGVCVISFPFHICTASQFLKQFKDPSAMIFIIEYCSALSKNSLWLLFLAYLWQDNTLNLYSLMQKIYFLFTIRREHQVKNNRTESNGLERKHTHLHLFMCKVVTLNISLAHRDYRNVQLKRDILDTNSLQSCVHIISLPFV